MYLLQRKHGYAQLHKELPVVSGNSEMQNVWTILSIHFFN